MSLVWNIGASQAVISGLVNALQLIQPIKDKYSGVTYADLFQLASATAIEVLLTVAFNSIFFEMIDFLKILFIALKFRKLAAPNYP